MRSLVWLAGGVLLLVASRPVAGQTAADSLAVRAAALDYVEGFYAGDTLRLQRAIRTDFAKSGWFRQGNGPYQSEAMPWSEVMSYAASVRARNRPVPATLPRGVEILDLLDQTAAVKLTASWGTDYMLLAKYDGAWMISHVLWQIPVRRDP